MRIERVARTGDAMPDGNGRIGGFWLHPSVNNDGQVALSVVAAGTARGARDSEAVLLWQTGRLSIAVRAGQPAPDGDGVYGSSLPGVQPAFQPPALSDGGRIGTLAGVVGATPGRGMAMLRIERDDEAFAIAGVARLGDALPAGGLIADWLGGLEPLSPPGQMAFVPYDSGAAGWTAWVSDGTKATRILRSGDASPDGDGVIRGVQSARPALSRNGRVCLPIAVGDLTGPAQAALYYWDGAFGTLLARVGQAAPGGGHISALYEYPVIGADGRAVFAAQVSQFPRIETRIFQGAPGALQAALREGDTLPGVDRPIAGLLEPDVNDQGEIAAVAVLHWDGPDADDFAIVRVAGLSREVVARYADALPGGGRAGSLSVPQINNHGTVAFASDLQGQTGNGALLMRRPGGPLREVLRSGDALDGRIVRYVEFTALRDPGGRAVLNDHDQVAVRVSFTDGASGVYLATLLRADTNCDAAVNFEDIDPFVTALSDPAAYAAAWPQCDFTNADVNRDRQVTFDDIEPFVQALGGS